MKSIYYSILARKILLSVLLFQAADLSAQAYNYTQYKIEQGLAGNIVYSMTQDKDGFMWFITETGVSRFDGTSFRNFTISDGLPDNTIIHIYADTKGRVWFVPFNNGISYYYKGKIHNQLQDTVLGKMAFTAMVHSITEDREHNIMLSSLHELYALTAEDKIVSYNNEPLLYPYVQYVTSDGTGNIKALVPNRIYGLAKGKLTYLSGFCKVDVQQLVIRDSAIYWQTTNRFHMLAGKSVYQYNVRGINSFRMLNDSVVYLNTPKGCTLLNIRHSQEIDHFLPDENVSDCYTDREGNTWFSTLNNGVFRLRSTQFKSIRYVSGMKPLRIYTLWDNGDNLLAGTDNSCLKLGLQQGLQISKKVSRYFDKHISFIMENKDGLLLTSDDQLYYRSKSGRFFHTNVNLSIKKIAVKADGKILAAASCGLLQFNTPHSLDYSMRYKGRTTTVYIQQDSIYFGTPNGLYMINHDNVTTYLGNIHPNLRNRISAICTNADGTLWVATAGAGIVGLKGNRVVWHLDVSNGLSSNDCQCMVPDAGGALWVGTDKGLDQLTFHQDSIQVTNYTTADGLINGFINAVVVKGDTVYAGTPEGLTFFNKKKTTFFSQCDLKLLNISSNGQAVNDKALSSLNYRNTLIRIDFTAISFKSEGAVRYYYRLTRPDTVWRMTRQNFLEFISLPPGDYLLELFAVNKFNVRSKTIRIPLKVIPPFWQTGWFICVTIGLIIFITWGIVTQRNKIYNRRLAAKGRMEQRLHELEQKALRAQMNPHFIFNCLHAVQEYILDNDIISTNKYLSSFASLIRQTLDNSLQTMIPISDEISYLANYLNLEQLRFENTFHYAFHIDDELDTYRTRIPSMMLQPYIENAIRHGIQYKEEGNGQIDISFEKTDQYIICIVADNGIGRTAAKALRSAQHITYQSRGMQLTAERVHLLSRDLDSPIVIDIADITGDQGVSGTRVTIQLPLITL